MIAGTEFEVRGREHLPTGAAIVAGKHQSLWETFALLPLLNDPAVVLKRELTWIPDLRLVCPEVSMLPVDRDAGAGALKRLIGHARRAVADNRQILIFPEGHAAGHPMRRRTTSRGRQRFICSSMCRAYRYALNSGLYWPRRKFLRYPGTIIVEFLPAIPPGLKRKDYSARLEEAIETAPQPDWWPRGVETVNHN